MKKVMWILVLAAVGSGIAAYAATVKAQARGANGSSQPGEELR